MRKSPVNKVVVGWLSFLIDWISDTVNMVLFFQFKLKMAGHAAHRLHARKKKKKILGSWFHFLNVLSRGVSLPFKCGKAVFRWSRRLKSQKFSLSMNHGILTLGVIHKCISSKVADFFCYFLNPLSPSLGDLAKKNSKVSLSNTQYDKYLNAESSLKQIQDAHFQWSSN